MTDQQAALASDGRLSRLLDLLKSDPRNLALLSDAAETALDEGEPAKAAELLVRYSQIEALPLKETNLAGLAALRTGDYPVAAAFFERLIAGGEESPSLRFNLAWSLAMDKNLPDALTLLDDDTARLLPQAAMLRVQILHEHGRFDEAAENARDYIKLHSDYPPLMAAVSVLALDVGDEELAADCAARGGGHPDALSTLGTLALAENRAAEAVSIFDRALARNERAPRAWVGRGLAKLMSGENSGAAADIDQGAAMFGDHLGSWIAAGWAHFINKDVAASRKRFESALRLDPNFAETHGSLAVLDLLEGDPESARQRSQVALRLDRQCYSAALARALLAASAGHAADAQRIYTLAITTPVDESGRTIAQSLAKLGLS